MTTLTENSRIKLTPINATPSGEVVFTEGMESAPFELSADEQVPLMNLLARLYADSPMGVLREYAANAVDAHAVIQQTLPVEVTIPSEGNLLLVIRDFGVGMSKRELLGCFTKYGYSTKADDLGQIGAFGTGAKSAFSVTDQFTVISVKDGFKTHALINKDENGQGRMFIVSYEETDESSGTTVSIPVESAAPYIAASERLFSTWQTGSVKVNDVLNVSILDKMTAINDNYFAKSIVNKRWGYYSGHDYLSIIVAGMSYEVRDLSALIQGLGNPENRRPLEITESQKMLRAVAFAGVMVFEIGDLDFTPSRDEVAMTPRTIKKITETALQVHQDYLQWIQEQLDAVHITSPETYKHVKELLAAVYHMELYQAKREHPEMNLTATSFVTSLFKFSIQDDNQIKMKRTPDPSVRTVMDELVQALVSKNEMRLYGINGAFANYSALFIRKVRAHLIAEAKRHEHDIRHTVLVFIDNPVSMQLLQPTMLNEETIEATIIRRNEVATPRITGGERRVAPTATYALVAFPTNSSTHLVSQEPVTLETVMENPEDYIFTFERNPWDHSSVIAFPVELTHKKMIYLKRRQRVESFVGRFPQIMAAKDYYDAQIATVVAGFSDEQALALSILDRFSMQAFTEDALVNQLLDPEVRGALNQVKAWAATRKHGTWRISLPEAHPLYAKSTRLYELTRSLRMIARENDGSRIIVLALNAYYNGDL